MIPDFPCHQPAMNACFGRCGFPKSRLVSPKVIAALPELLLQLGRHEPFPNRLTPTLFQQFAFRYKTQTNAFLSKGKCKAALWQPDKGFSLELINVYINFCSICCQIICSAGRKVIFLEVNSREHCNTVGFQFAGPVLCRSCLVDFSWLNLVRNFNSSLHRISGFYFVRQ